MLETIEAYDGLMRDIASPIDRSPQARGSVRLPEGTVVVSADSHWSLSEDIFYERFPAHLKESAPRIRKNEQGIYNWYVKGKSFIPPAALNTFALFDTIPGSTQLAPRLRDMDIEGVDKEINFGNAIGAGLVDPDTEVREHVFRIYNQHLSEMQAKAPGRFYGVGVINYWDMDKVRDSVLELKDLGLKTFLLPQNPRGAGGRPLDYCSAEMAPLWEAADEAGLPISYHVGEFFKEGPGGMGTTVMGSFGPFRKSLGELIFGGIFDRHPSLQVVFAEAEINWVPGALQTASMAYECYKPLLEPMIKHHPRHYWQNNCYATFIHDPVGLRMLDIVGADRVMWGADYPHTESAYGSSWDVMQAIIDVTTEDQARMILGGTAMKVFKLD